MGAPSDRKEPGADRKIFHRGPARQTRALVGSCARPSAARCALSRNVLSRAPQRPGGSLWVRWAPRRAQIHTRPVFWPYNLNQVHYGHGFLFLSYGKGPSGANGNSRPTLFRRGCFDFRDEPPNFRVTRDGGPHSTPLVLNELGLELPIDPLGVPVPPRFPDKTVWPWRIWFESCGSERGPPHST